MRRRECEHENLKEAPAPPGELPPGLSHLGLVFIFWELCGEREREKREGEGERERGAKLL